MKAIRAAWSLSSNPVFSPAPIRSPLDMEVVLVLRSTTRALTGREVARLVRAGSQPTVNAALRRLAEVGIVQAEEAGNAYLYTLNREHPASGRKAGRPRRAVPRKSPPTGGHS